MGGNLAEAATSAASMQFTALGSGIQKPSLGGGALVGGGGHSDFG